MRVKIKPPTSHTTFLFTLLLAAGVVLLSSQSGCVSYRGYRVVDEVGANGIFGRYGIGAWAGHYYVDKDDDTCSLQIWQEYRPDQADTIQIDSLCEIKISLLCIEVDCKEQSYCPSEQDTRVLGERYWKDGVLKGPCYDFYPVLIPKKCKLIHVSFVAALVDTRTGIELERKPVRLALQKTTNQSTQRNRR